MSETFTPLRKSDFTVVRRIHSATSAKMRKTIWDVYTVEMVSRATRDGVVVKTHRTATGPSMSADAVEFFRVPDHARPHAVELWGRDFRSLDDVKAAFKGEGD